MKPLTTKERAETSYTYRLTGTVNYNESDETEDGNIDVDISETVEIDTKSARDAFAKFFDDNPQYDFFGNHVVSCDADTCGKVWARFKDQTADRSVMVELQLFAS